MKSKILQGILIALLLLVVSCWHPLNAKADTNVGPKTYYIAVPGVVLENTIVYGSTVWVDLESLKDLIRLDVAGKQDLLAYQYRIYIKNGQVLLVQPYKVNAVFVEVYLTFTIFKIIR